MRRSEKMTMKQPVIEDQNMKNSRKWCRFVTWALVIFATTWGAGCGDDDSGVMIPTSGNDAGTTRDGGPTPDTDGGTGEPAPLGPNAMPSLGAQIDRMGRAAVNTALTENFNGDSAAKGAAKDAYNADGDPSSWAERYTSMFAGSLAILDALDANCGNQFLAAEEPAAGRYDTLASVLADDRIYVHSGSGTCGVYLGVEAEAVGAVEAGAGGCGGRTPNDDVIDRTYSLLAAGLLTGVDDTITQDARDHSADSFPFLADPN